MTVTINDVAKHAGVSKKTVSRVLNNEPNVSQQTKDKVHQTFLELGYKPSSMARGLASNKSFLIGLIYDNPNKSYVVDVQEGALKVCNDQGYHLIIHPADHTCEQVYQEIQSFVMSSRLDGLVITPPFSDNKQLLTLLEKLDVPTVRVGATFEYAPHLSISTNDAEASYQMTKHLIELGHKLIAFIKGHPDHSVSELRYQGYKRAMDEHNIDIHPELIKTGDFSFESGEHTSVELLNNPEIRPTAIFASNDEMAAGVLKVAQQMKVRVPESLSVAGFDDTEIAIHLWPSLTTVRQPVRQMAEQAVSMLFNSFNENNQLELNHELQDELKLRASTKAKTTY